MRARVRTAKVARLATTDPDGRPHLVPIVFVLDGQTLYSAVDAKPKRSRRLRRVANARERPDVTVLVDHYEDDWGRLWWVRVRGRAREPLLCSGVAVAATPPSRHVRRAISRRELNCDKSSTATNAAN